MSLHESTFFDDSLWPLLTVRVRPARSLQELDKALAMHVAYLKRPEKHVTIMDTRHVGASSPALRQRHAEWLSEHASLMREKMFGTAYIITSPLVRLAFSIILHLKKSPVPYVVVSSEEAAALWAAERFEEAGLPLPAQRIRQHWQPARISQAR